MIGATQLSGKRERVQNEKTFLSRKGSRANVVAQMRKERERAKKNEQNRKGMKRKGNGQKAKRTTKHHSKYQ